MADELHVDVVLEGADPAVLAQVHQALADLGPTTLEPTRELMTIISVVSAATLLTQRLIDLWKSTRKAPPAAANAPARAPVSIVIEVQSGATLNFGDVTSADEIQAFVATHASPAAS